MTFALYTLLSLALWLLCGHVADVADSQTWKRRGHE